MTDTPPDWVLIEAAKRVGWGCGVLLAANAYSNPDTKGRIFRALCDMIWKYENPPVDRKLLCAREAMRQWEELLPRGDDDWEWIALRTIVLWEEGFGRD